MTTILSRFSTNSIDLDIFEVLEELVYFFRTAQQSEGQIESELTQFDNMYDDALRRCDDFRDVFTLVKQSVRENMNQEHPNMLLQLVDLPLHIGAAHPIGTNRIVMNKALLKLAVQHRSLLEVKAFVFSILLHEYIHSLGYLNEYETRELVYRISRSTFGLNHIVTHIAKYGPWYIFERNLVMQLSRKRN